MAVRSADKGVLIIFPESFDFDCVKRKLVDMRENDDWKIYSQFNSVNSDWTKENPLGFLLKGKILISEGCYVDGFEWPNIIYLLCKRNLVSHINIYLRCTTNLFIVNE